jgi:hypothetical protein
MRHFLILAALILLWQLPALGQCAQSGTTWNCAAASTPTQVEAAITAASQGATVNLAAGTHTTTFNMANEWIGLIRGATLVFHDNVLPSLNRGSHYPKTSDGDIQLQQLSRANSNTGDGCWGVGGTNGPYHHIPRQTGFGYVTGSGTVNYPPNGWNNSSTDKITYGGDSEPGYILNNTRTPRGGIVNLNVIATDYDGTGCGSPEDFAADYVKVNRDYLPRAKTPYIPYTYPHPLTVSDPPVAAVTPTFSPGSGLPPQTVTISTTTPGAIICYNFGQIAPVVTTPGTCPSGTLYTRPVSVTRTNNTLNAVATITGGMSSAIATAFYTGAITRCSVPLIGGGYVAFDPSGQAATVSWVTNVPADSLVVYGGANPGTAYGVYNASNPQFPTPFDATGVTTHSVKVSGLFPGFGQKFDARSQAINGGVPCRTGYYKRLSNLQGRTPVPPTTGSLDYVIGPGNGNTLTFGPLNGHPSTSPDADYPASPSGWGNGPLGGQYITQGYGLYLRLQIGRLSGAWNVAQGLKLVVSGLPTGAYVAWVGTDCWLTNPCTTTYKNVPDINNGNGAQGFFGSGETEQTTTVNYDTLLTNVGDSWQREIFIGTIGSTPPGTYNVTITGSANNGSGYPTHSTIWPITVVSSSAPFSGVPLAKGMPTSYPTIPQLDLYNSNAYTYGKQSCAQDQTNQGTRDFIPNDTVVPYGIAAPHMCCTYSSWFYDGTEAYYNVEAMLNNPRYNPSYPKYAGTNWSQCRANVKQTYMDQVLDTGKVVISGGGGTGAVGAVTTNGTTGKVTNLILVAGGSGYTSNPTCTIVGNVRDNIAPELLAAATGATRATCTATAAGGTVTNLTLTNAGTQYFAGQNPNLVYTITGATWSAGVATLTVSGTLPIDSGKRAPISVSGVTSSGAGSYNNGGQNPGSIYNSGLTANTIKYPLAIDPGTFLGGGTVKFSGNGHFQSYFELLTFSKGFYRDYLQTGNPDDLSLIAKWLQQDPFLGNGGIVDVGYSQRETAYLLRNETHAAKLGFTKEPSSWANYGSGQVPAWWREYALDHVLGQVDQICLSQNAEYWENFMAGLQMMELLEYYEVTNKDPRIPPAIACLAGYLYKNQWGATDPGAFPYDKEGQLLNTSTANGGGCYSALNMMVAPAYAWLFQYTGNANDPIGGHGWQYEGDDIFSAGARFVCSPPVQSGAKYALTFPIDSGGKQYSQNYSWGPNYVFWRSAPQGPIHTSDRLLSRIKGWALRAWR